MEQIEAMEAPLAVSAGETQGARRASGVSRARGYREMVKMLEDAGVR